MTRVENGSRWRLLVTPAATGAENMALDEALMSRACETGEWVLRVYSWSRPTLSFGRNQTARERYDLGAIVARGFDVVRRPTGGRAILHHREVTYSVTAPAASAGDLRASYARINRILLDALHTLGVDAAVATEGRGASAPRAPSATPCFAEPAPGELTVAGRKLAGSAQYRVDGALLQHGSILVADDQSVLASLAVDPEPPLPPPATLAGTLGRIPSVCDVADVLVGAVRRLEDSRASSLQPDDRLRAHASALVVQYSDEAWTWRR